MAVINAISSSNAPSTPSKITVTASRNFNHIYREKGTHPGVPFFFSSNCESDMVKHRYDVKNTHKVRVVTPAYRSNGTVLEGWVAVFIAL
jgi:hypothetical protein